MTATREFVPPVVDTAWQPVGTTGRSMRCGDLVIVVDPDAPEYFYVDDDRPVGSGGRLLYERIPLEGIDCVDGVERVLLMIAARMAEEGIAGVLPADGLTAWYSLAEQPLLDAAAAETEDVNRARSVLQSERVNLATVVPTAIQPLWGGNRIALKKVTLGVGDPGEGKSYTSLAIAAALSNVGHRVLILQVEDSLDDTTVPRLMKLGADLTKIEAFPIGAAPVLTAEGLVKLEQHLAEYRPSFVIVDPVTYFIGAKMDMHRANQVRGVMGALSALADRYACAILPLIHMNKGNQKALYRALGSIDFTAAVRSMLLFGSVEEQPERGHAIFHVKCNYGPKEDPVGYRITDAGFDWVVPTDLTLAEVQGSKPGPKPVKKAATLKWLFDLLADGPRPVAEVKAAASDEGISERMLKTASEDATWLTKTRVEGAGGSGWVWSREAPVGDTAEAVDGTHWR